MEYGDPLRQMSPPQSADLRKKLAVLGYESEGAHGEDALGEALERFAADRRLDSNNVAGLIEAVDERFRRLPFGSFAVSRESASDLAELGQVLSNVVARVNRAIASAPAVVGSPSVSLIAVSIDGGGGLHLRFDMGSAARPNVYCYCDPPGICVPCADTYPSHCQDMMCW